MVRLVVKMVSKEGSILKTDKMKSTLPPTFFPKFGQIYLYICGTHINIALLEWQSGYSLILY